MPTPTRAEAEQTCQKIGNCKLVKLELGTEWTFRCAPVVLPSDKRYVMNGVASSANAMLRQAGFQRALLPLQGKWHGIAANMGPGASTVEDAKDRVRTGDFCLNYTSSPLNKVRCMSNQWFFSDSYDIFECLGLDIKRIGSFLIDWVLIPLFSLLPGNMGKLVRTL